MKVCILDYKISLLPINYTVEVSFEFFLILWFQLDSYAVSEPEV